MEIFRVWIYTFVHSMVPEASIQLLNKTCLFIFQTGGITRTYQNYTKQKSLEIRGFTRIPILDDGGELLSPCPIYAIISLLRFTTPE